jgi:hypothetical protein
MSTILHPTSSGETISRLPLITLQKSDGHLQNCEPTIRSSLRRQGVCKKTLARAWLGKSKEDKAMAKYTFVVLTNATAGKEDDFNEWYNKHHIPDVLNVPGFVSGQRFRLAETQMGGKSSESYKYLALYEIETDDLAGTLKELRARGGTADMVLSDAIDMKNVGSFIFTPIAQKVMASDVRRPRRAA